MIQMDYPVLRMPVLLSLILLLSAFGMAAVAGAEEQTCGGISIDSPGVLGDGNRKPCPPQILDDVSPGSPGVLPGFVPMEFNNGTIKLHERTYQWEHGFLPSSILSRGRVLVSRIALMTEKEGRLTALYPAREQWLRTAPNEMIREASLSRDDLKVGLRAMVDYDGVIEVELTLNPGDRPNGNVYLVMELPRSPNTVVMGWGADGIREQKNRHDILSLPYRGPFLNAIDVADGDRSFWWFADNESGWLGNPADMVRIEPDADVIRITQRIVARAASLRQDHRIRFGLLATPVKPIPNASRRERIILGVPSNEEKNLGARFKMWWATGFAYDAYPYTSIQPDADSARLSPADRAAYPGLAANKKQIDRDRELYGSYWLPYFSAHVLSSLDPMLAANRSRWEIAPTKVFRDVLSPYDYQYEKPVLTHNAPGYSDYLITRFRSLISEMGIDGVYLDHGPVHDSANPLNGGWTDDNGIRRASLDIFATRSFLKRLRSAFVEQGRAGYVYVHTSNREIIPAYTFAHALVSGEQYRTRVRDGRYLDLVPMYEFRTRFAGGQYGVPIVWMPQDWPNFEDDPSWQDSENQRVSTRRVESLALLHDVPLWPVGAHREERRSLLTLLDRFGIDRASFLGYWSDERLLRSSNGLILLSEYVRKGRRLAVISNVTGRPQEARIEAKSGNRCNLLRVLSQSDSGPDSQDTMSGVQVSLGPFDFTLIEARVSDQCPGSVPGI